MAAIVKDLPASRVRLLQLQLIAVHDDDVDAGGFVNYVGYDDEVADYYDEVEVDGGNGGCLFVYELQYDCVLYSVRDDSLTRRDWNVAAGADDVVEIVHDHWQWLRPRCEHRQHYGVLLANCEAPENVTMDLDDIFAAFLLWPLLSCCSTALELQQKLGDGLYFHNHFLFIGYLLAFCITLSNGALNASSFS
ncbi:hypothetical protein FF38_10783 [Lucilia cuprina]|uniref:Uncharacterized protein n=1 Tax=Lucilia cuprina TaxID=7375 RepID=A0A0L0C492_LUCCU|nr:hypothetical protein FF38_10783 [Lucilia cuprina]